MGRRKKGTEGKWQDVWFGVAFLVHLAVTGLIYVVTMSKSEKEVYEGLVPSTTRQYVPLLMKAIVLSAVGAVLLGYVALAIMRSFPRFCIHGAMITNLVVLASIAIVLMVKVKWWVGLIFMIFPLMWAFIYWGMIPLIPFLAELLTAVSDLVMKYPSTVVLNIVSVILQFGWIMLFSYFTLAIQARYAKGSVIGLTIYMLLSFFWTMQMLKNIVHTTNCGVFASWFFLSNTPNMPSSPMVGSLKRSMTTSFGSIALGSLVVAAIQTLRTLASIGARNAENNVNGGGSGGDQCISLVLCILGNIARCILSCIESIAMYINHYAFVIVATYGQSYIQAGKTTLNMFLRTGFVNLLNDNMLDRLQFAVCTLNASIIALCALPISKLFLGVSSSSYTGVVCASAFVSSFLITSLILQTLESGAATIYVCFAEDSAALARTNPSLYLRMRNTFGGDIVASNNMDDVL